ncbi:MAG: chloramphenicol acetyltransferase [Marinilabiliales bacterium]|nr:MAG: chloramphenicol acetyltransferase [Marinilabiliales bacterium]
MKKTIDYKNWKRREHFEWFRNFDEPFFGIVSEVDCSEAYNNSKKNGIPFFHSYLHKSLKAVNLLEDFRLRIENDQIVCFDKIHASATLNNADGLYAMSFIEYDANLDRFRKNIKKESDRVKQISGLGVNSDTARKDTIHYSSVPWFKITGLTHARNYKYKDSVPKITFGKLQEINNKRIMNISINGHHGLMDGSHVAKYLDLFQNLLNAID